MCSNISICPSQPAERIPRYVNAPPPPAPSSHLTRPLYFELFIILTVQNILLSVSILVSLNKSKYLTCRSSGMQSSFDAQKRCFPIFYTSIYKKANDLGRPFSVGKTKASQVGSSCRTSFSGKLSRKTNLR